MAKRRAVKRIKSRRKIEKADGFGEFEKRRVRQAVRKVWHQSRARQIVVKRCIGVDGFPVCELCGEMVPKVTIDHIEPVGEVDQGFLERMFVSSQALQGLCNACHREKTNRQNKELRDLKKRRSKK